MSNSKTLALALGLLLPSLACDLEALPTSDRAGPAADDDARPQHRPGGLPAPLVLLERAVEAGELQDDPGMAQALADLHTAHDEAVAAGEALRLTLADAVATGAITDEQAAGPLAAIADAAAREGGALTTALDTAHALLDADLREQIVDELPPPPPRPRADAAPRSGTGPGDGEPGLPPPGADPGPGRLLDALALDAAQQAALREALGEPTPPEPPAPLDLAQFADDGFEAAQLGLAELHAARTTEQASHQVELLIVLVPLLDEAQRTTLESLLRTAPPEPTPGARG